MIERRFLPAAPPSTAPKRATATAQRATVIAPGVVVAGLAVPFMAWSRPIGGAFIERFHPNAFDAQARRGWGDVVGQFMHDRLAPLATIHARTLVLEVRPDGLYYRMELPDSAAYVAELVERGDLQGASIGFYEIEGEWDLDPQGRATRTVKRARLGEVSLVTFPAYPQTTAKVKAAGSAARLDAPDGGGSRMSTRLARRGLDLRARRLPGHRARKEEARR